jgi:hypothetical protein
VINICKTADGCIPTPPELRISFLSGTNEIAKFKTAPIVTKSSPIWLKQSGTFTIPPGVKEMTIYMEDITEGGCGNDFALDDFILKECSIKQSTIPAEIPPKPSSKEDQPKENLEFNKRILRKKLLKIHRLKMKYPFLKSLPRLNSNHKLHYLLFPNPFLQDQILL